MSEPEENINPGLTGGEIAVIGMAGRFPGARSIAEFWENLKQGKESIPYFSDEELIESGNSPELLTDSHYVKAKAMMEDVDYFDPAFFNYTMLEAEMMDPQLRILHECTWQALEDAGYNPDKYEGFIGFYVGAGTNFYWLARLLAHTKNPSENFGLVSLNDSYAVSTQVSYRLNLKGPALTLQTACSTSLVAIHTACQALLAGECDMALAGGVSVKLPVKNGYIFQGGMVLSPDGHCRTFDARAAGTVSGDGVGVVLLKPLENALEDRDHIYAVVKGSAVNNDGSRKVGYSAPSVKGQAEVIRIAQQAAQVEPESITYVEAHGTATNLGDPVEMRALVQAFATDKKQFCRIGSVKSNVGHLDNAAGAAGFIKTVLALYHQLVPPSLHFETPNPEIDFENTPFIVNTELHRWQNDKFPLRAGVSSFGIGGTNVHVILEAWSTGGRGEFMYSRPGSRPFHLMLLSARTSSALERITGNLVDFLENHPGLNFVDMAYTLQLGRKSFAYRRSLVCRDAQEAVHLLSSGDSKKVHTHHLTSDENPLVVFMFSGLGSQYVNMGFDLYQDEPVFRQEMDRCFEILRPLLGYDLEDVLYPRLSNKRPANGNQVATTDIDQPQISQLVVFIFEYVLAKLLLKWGIKPSCMIGYSFGEYVAACIAGVFDLEQALKLIVQRGRLIDKTPPGAMLSVPLARQELRSLLHARPELSLAIDNGPSCIVAGTKAAVEVFAGELKQKKYLCMYLNTCHAIHSHLMNSILDEFEARVRSITLKAPQIPYISNVTGQWITAEEVIEPAYWTRHLASTVRFADGINELVKEPRVVFIELGPGRDLSTMIQRCLGEDHLHLNLVRPAQKEVPDTAYLLDRLGRLWLYGLQPDWDGFYDSRTGYRVPLPTYPFEKQGFPVDGSGIRQLGVDQEAEPTYQYRRTHLPEDYEAPRGEVEERIAGAFQNIFGLEPIGIQEDFFELGGDSLKVITLVTHLHQQLDVDIPMDVVFKHPTIKELAGYIEEKIGTSIYVSIPPVEEREYYPLSPSQKRVFILDRLEDRNRAYNLPTVLWMEGRLDIKGLERACRGLLQRHESLRTGFFLHGSEPVQRVYRLEEVESGLEYSDLYHPDVTARDGISGLSPSVENIIADFVQPFDLSCPPLWRVGLVRLEADKYLLMQNIHHIITDDISTGVMINELSLLYQGQSLENLPVQYKDYALWQEQAVAAHTMLDTQKEFWLALFSDAPYLPVLEIPADFPRPQVQEFEGAHIELKIDADLTRKLAELARTSRTTLFVLLFTIYNTLLYGYTSQEDIIVGTPITGRSHRDVQQVVGMFVNTLALRNHPQGDKGFAEFLKEVKERTLEAFSNQLFQFEDLVEQLDIPRHTNRSPLFDTMFVLHTVDLEKVNIPAVRMYPYEFETPVSKFDITFNVAESVKRELNVILEYSTALFKRDTMQQFLADFLFIAETVVDNPQVRLAEIEIFAVKKREEEKRRILYEFNNTLVDYPADKTLKDLLEEQAARTPDRIAVVGADARVQDIFADAVFELLTLTYQELNDRTNQLAHHLQSLGVTANTIVGLLTERTAQMIIGLLAIIKSGAAYLPIGPEYPVDRVRYMVQHTETPIILTTEAELPFDHGVQIINLTRHVDSSTWDRSGLPTCCCPGDLAYVIYTSGTTGVPKGVMIENRSLVNFIKGITDIIPFTTYDSILSLTTLAFDIFGLETLLPLTRGTKVVIGNIEEQLDAAAAAAAIRKQGINILQLTPSRLELFISQPEAGRSLGQLTYLLVGGEVFPRSLLEKVSTLIQGKIYNLYGPTETTIWSCIKDVSGDESLNIGKPLANTRIYILDKAGHLQPIGLIGELCISGHGVARGYFKDEALSRDKFFENPFISTDDPDGSGHERLYRTGDLARWLPEGNIEFLGRSDHQVKIRGFRIEPGEIEYRLLTHEAIKEAVVLAKDEGNGSRSLWAYIVSDKELEIPQLREYLGRDLPDYMIPAYFMKIEKIPLTPNGKIDRKALLHARGSLLKADSTYVAPGTELEKTIADIWKKTLQLDKVGMADNFFDLGGSSLKVIKIVSDLKETLKREIPVVTMFRYPTIASISRYLNQEGAVPKRKDRSAIKEKGRERLSRKRSLKAGK